ncbi:MAG: hypothetical protein RBR15_05170 [Sphaerochaeta sp.]|nr:hypothetical protein [Sphaerochaeta sp.]
MLAAYKEKDEMPHIFSKLEPLEGAIEAYTFLHSHFDTYILSTAPWNDPCPWSEKLLWVKQYLGDVALKHLILTHHKNLNRGDYLIDDRTENGAGRFGGELILFGSPEYPDWKKVLKYMKTQLP